jgi:hypothetical protein
MPQFDPGGRHQVRRIDRTTILLVGITGLMASSAPALRAQPSRPPPSREQVAQMAAKRQAFCDGVQKLGVLTKTDFRSIDKGLRPGSDLFHASALTLPDAKDCYISTINGDTEHTCAFPSKPEVLGAQIRGMNNLLARCLGVPAPKVTTDEMGDGSVIIQGGVRYSLQTNDFGEDEPVDVSLHVEKSK